MTESNCKNGGEGDEASPSDSSIASFPIESKSEASGAKTSENAKKEEAYSSGKGNANSMKECHTNNTAKSIAIQQSTRDIVYCENRKEHSGNESYNDLLSTNVGKSVS